MKAAVLLAVLALQSKHCTDARAHTQCAKQRTTTVADCESSSFGSSNNEHVRRQQAPFCGKQAHQPRPSSAGGA